MTYNVFSGTLNLTQSINRSLCLGSGGFVKQTQSGFLASSFQLFECVGLVFVLLVYCVFC